MGTPEQKEAFELARQRIAEAKERGEKILCLSPTGLVLDGRDYNGDTRFEHLAALPPELADHKRLELLDVKGTQIVEIALLAQLKGLQTLNLTKTNVVDLSPLAGLPLLGSLLLARSSIFDVTPLARLPSLFYLDLSLTNVSDVTALAKAVNLRWLDLSGSKVRDISPVAGLENLKELWFANTPACDADPTLADLAKIRDDENRARRTLAYLRGEEPDEPVSKLEQTTGPNISNDIPPDRIRYIQQVLADAGFDPGATDGIAGPNTERAIQSALRAAKINGSGSLEQDFIALHDFLILIVQAIAPPPRPDETAPFYDDEPATEDRLNRRAVAKALGTIVDSVWKDEREKARKAAEAKANGHADGPQTDRDRSFIVHLHGRWGSGKTSILNFLRKELLSGKIAEPVLRDRWLDRLPDPAWVVVDYNAWRNQSLGPAWWTLMDTVYREAAGQLGGWLRDDGLRVRLGHFLWRFRSRWKENLLIIGIAIAVVIGVVMIDLGPVWNDSVKYAGSIITVVVAVLGLLGRLGLGSAQTAKRYMELSNDPHTPLIDRYSALIDEIRRPVAVFIDDLDRCEAKFVVELLQNIQTLFRGAQVLYVVAADRNWICSSYEQVYATYREPIAEPGHSIGNMFLEKIFQLSVEVPALAGAQRDAFWDHLIRRKEEKVTPAERAAIEREVAETIDRETTEAGVTKARDELAERGPEFRAAAGERAFQRMQSQELSAEREHLLADYAKLLEANPRAMKRLLNAYGFRRGFDLQADEAHRADRDALVRWTIIENRWPVLAAHIADRLTGQSQAGSGPEELEALMKSAEFARVAEGLTEERLAPIIGAERRAENESAPQRPQGDATR